MALVCLQRCFYTECSNPVLLECGWVWGSNGGACSGIPPPGVTFWMNQSGDDYHFNVGNRWNHNSRNVWCRQANRTLMTGTWTRRHVTNQMSEWSSLVHQDTFLCSDVSGNGPSVCSAPSFMELWSLSFKQHFLLTTGCGVPFAAPPTITSNPGLLLPDLQSVNCRFPSVEVQTVVQMAQLTDGCYCLDMTNPSLLGGGGVLVCPFLWFDWIYFIYPQVAGNQRQWGRQQRNVLNEWMRLVWFQLVWHLMSFVTSD